MVYLLFVSGFVLLMAGANVLIEGAGSVGRRMGMSPVVIGFTIVALGTSLPELIINVFAASRGETDLAITNVLGSNIMNTLFIVGVAAMILPIVPGNKTTFTLVPVSLLAGIALMLFANFSLLPWSPAGTISRWEGVGLLVLLVGYLLFSKKFGKGEGDEEGAIKVMGLPRSLIMIVIGILGLYFGGNWVVEGAVVIASDFGISQAMIGITVIAVATSLPELVTSVIAAYKKNSGIALGNALGSNVFNVFLVLGISSLIRPLPFSAQFNIDAGVMVFSNFIVFLFVFAGRGRVINRLEGILMMLAYIVYIATLVLRN